MWAKHPEIAKRWAEEMEKDKAKKEAISRKLKGGK